MKKILLFLPILFLMPFFDVYAEEISHFDVVATINEDASVDVIETIDYDYGSLQKHGIYRDIPVKYTNATGDNRTVKISDISVTDQSGKKYTSDVSREGSDLRIKIGDADKYVTGEKRYVIKYTVAGALNYFDDHDEFYWNATGDRWEVPIRTSHITVHAPQITRTACFAGVYGSTNACSDTENVTDESVIFAHEDIVPGSGMTFVIGMPAGTVYKPTMGQKILQYIMDNWVLSVPIFVFCGMWRLWYVKGRDPEGKGTVVPYYESPEELTAAEVGMIMRNAVMPESISAAIIQLAVNGYMIIKKIDKKGLFSSDDYEFISTGKDVSDLSAQNKLLYDAIFSGAKDSLSIEEVFGDMSDGVLPKIDEENIKSRKMSDLKDKFYKKLDKIKDSVEKSIMQKGYYTGSPTTVRAFYIAVGVFMLLGSFFAGSVFGLAYGVALFFSSLPVLVFGSLMPQRTRKGSIVREEILGLKLYMNTAEKDRINFHNAPEKKPERFEKLLPYAMALGVEEAWAKQFEDIYKNKPQWYQSSDPSFSPMILAHSMQSFSEANNATMVSKPSSAGSGGSGFSGGGSGGGFGGGGGGSW